MNSLQHLAQSTPPPDFNFITPAKRIHDGSDVEFFLHSVAYRDITTFILQLNRSLVPRKRSSDGTVREFRLDDQQHPQLNHNVASLQSLISKLELLINEAPPDTGPRRFGNISFRRWHQLVEDQCQTLLEAWLPSHLHSAIIEVKAYLLGSFGSPQRLDYGTGHELSFMAFLAILWRIGYFTTPRSTSQSSAPNPTPEELSVSTDPSMSLERDIVLFVFQPYLKLIRSLIITYNLEPAGSHGVWGLDDNSFLPYLFGSAQLCPPIPDESEVSPDGVADVPSYVPTPITGSLSTAPEPSIVTQRNLVQREATSNLYFSTIDFIYAVKRGPFWEHSPVLFDISGIRDGWGKINKGLIKMYDAEVLSKFPVVQHFPFGNLLKWEKDPDARKTPQATHQASQPLRDPSSNSNGASISTTRLASGTGAGIGTAAPWASTGVKTAPTPIGFVHGATQAPWARAGASSASTGRMPPPSLLPQSSRPSARLAAGQKTNSERKPGPTPLTAPAQEDVKLAVRIPDAVAEEKSQ